MSRKFDYLGDVEVFLAVVEHGSFTAGAVALSTTPSVLSRAVTRLEARLGRQLLQRTTRRVGLTDAGRLYREQVRTAFGLLGFVLAGRRKESGGETGKRRIAVPWFAFAYARLLFDPIYPPTTLAAIYVSGSALAFMSAERERREIRGAFGHYLSPDVVEQLARKAELGPERVRDVRRGRVQAAQQDAEALGGGGLVAAAGDAVLASGNSAFSMAIDGSTTAAPANASTDFTRCVVASF